MLCKAFHHCFFVSQSLPFDQIEQLCNDIKKGLREGRRRQSIGTCSFTSLLATNFFVSPSVTESNSCAFNLLFFLTRNLFSYLYVLNGDYPNLTEVNFSVNGNDIRLILLQSNNRVCNALCVEPKVNSLFNDVLKAQNRFN
jgi:hypothetical protein